MGSTSVVRVRNASTVALLIVCTRFTSTRTPPTLPAHAPNRHAILRPQADGVRVEDLGSLNGSFVNEDRLEGTAVLRGGDVLQVGQSVVKITS